MTAAPRHLTGHASPPWCALPPRARVLRRAVRGVSPGGHYSITVSEALPVAAPVAGQARVPSRAEQEAAKLPDDRDKLPVDLPEAVGGAGCTRRCRQPGPEGCASTSGRGGDAVGVHERISPASVETRRPDRSVEEPAHDPLAVMSQPTLWGHASRVPGRGLAGGCAPSDPPNGNGTSWALASTCG